MTVAEVVLFKAVCVYITQSQVGGNECICWALQINVCAKFACVHGRARLGSIPHRLCLTGCPCRVNKTNLRSGLALGEGVLGGVFTRVESTSGVEDTHTCTHTYAHNDFEIVPAADPH